MSTTPPLEEFELHMPDDLDVEHCYRHPDRETGVHCSECGRPICHECMTPAAVGFRCPECMAEQRRGAGRPRVITRQQTRSRWQRSGVMGGSAGLTVTKALIAINVAVFLVEEATGALSSTAEIVHLGALAPVLVAVNHDYWRMVSSMFLHESILHIGLNMLALWFLGEFTEAVLGHVKFLVLYMVTGLAGSVFVVLFSPATTLTIGASGAIAGVFGGLMAYAFLNRHRDYMARAILGQLVFWFMLNLILNLSDRTLSWQGHLGGFVTGMVLVTGYTLLGRKNPGGRFTGADIAITVAVVALLVVLTFYRVQTFTLATLVPWL
ncbi:MAG: rhomboid family intramembrane serine protease [Thermoleophilia bacterium]